MDRWGMLLWWLLLAAGCGDDAAVPDAGTTPDAGAMPDVRTMDASVLDAGSESDGAVASDAGDGGLGRDAAATPDASVSDGGGSCVPGLTAPVAVACVEEASAGRTCAGSLTVPPLSTVTFDDTGSVDPDGTTLTHAWRLASVPSGSTTVLSDPTTPAPTLFAAVAGDYVACLVVTDADGCESTESCITLHVVPDERLHVQLVWNRDDTDMDLHLVLDDIANFADDGSGPPGGTTDCPNALDCSWECRNPSWGAVTVDDDPRLDLDNTTGFGPENLNVTEPFDHDPYVIAVHYFCDRGHGPSTATVRLYVDGVLEKTWSRVLATGDRWYVADLAWDGAAVPVYTVTDRDTVDTFPGCM